MGWSQGAGQAGHLSANPAGDELMDGPQLGTKSFEIQKRLVFEAWMKVQANNGRRAWTPSALKASQTTRGATSTSCGTG